MNQMKEKLDSGEVAIGVSAEPGSEIPFLARSGFDFLLFDTQHSPVEIKQLNGPINSMRGRHAIPIVRVGDNTAEATCYALDVGAKGIICPMINTPEEAEAMVQYCKYPFDGVRSSAGPRGEWGEFKSYREYMDIVNHDLLIIPMVETVEGLKNVKDIASVEGINCVLIGPSDLSINIDVPLDYENPKYHEAISGLARTCREHDVAPGMFFVPPGISPAQLIEMGFLFFTYAWQQWASAGIKNGLDAIRS